MLIVVKHVVERFKCNHHHHNRVIDRLDAAHRHAAHLHRRQAGAAGTVATNLTALGAGHVEAVGFYGDDGEGFELTPFNRLARTHCLMVAADTLLAIALADSVFFDIDPADARMTVSISRAPSGSSGRSSSRRTSAEPKPAARPWRRR